MISIRTGQALRRALNSPINDQLKQLLTLRRAQLGGDITDHAHFVVVEAADIPGDLERTIGFSVFQNAGDDSQLGEPEFTPGWEWIEDHGFAYELCFILDDSGFAHVVIIPKGQGVDPELFEFLRSLRVGTRLITEAPS